MDQLAEKKDIEDRLSYMVCMVNGDDNTFTQQYHNYNNNY